MKWVKSRLLYIILLSSLSLFFYFYNYDVDKDNSYCKSVFLKTDEQNGSFYDEDNKVEIRVYYDSENINSYIVNNFQIQFLGSSYKIDNSDFLRKSDSAENPTLNEVVSLTLPVKPCLY